MMPSGPGAKLWRVLVVWLQGLARLGFGQCGSNLVDLDAAGVWARLVWLQGEVSMSGGGRSVVLELSLVPRLCFWKSPTFSASVVRGLATVGVHLGGSFAMRTKSHRSISGGI